MKVNRLGWRIDGIMGKEYRLPRKYPLRQAVRWNAAEDQDLIAQFMAGAHIEDIAAYHQRSAGGVGTRLERLNVIPNSRADYFYKGIRRVSYDGGQPQRQSDRHADEAWREHLQHLDS